MVILSTHVERLDKGMCLLKCKVNGLHSDYENKGTIRSKASLLLYASMLCNTYQFG